MKWATGNSQDCINTNQTILGTLMVFLLEKYMCPDGIETVRPTVFSERERNYSNENKRLYFDFCFIQK